MIDCHKVPLPLSNIPHDVLVRCVVEYLKKREQYVLFSLCSSLKPLLYHCRTIHIQDTEEDLGFASEKITKNILSSVHEWTWFKTSEEHRQKLLRIVGIGSAGERLIIESKRRPLRLSINYEELRESTSLVHQYVHCFDTITVNYPTYKYSNYNPQTTLTAPTSESVERFLQSVWKKDVGDLRTMWKVAQQVSLLPDSVVSESASLSTLRGVCGLLMKGGESLFVELSPDREARLHSVVLDSCEEIWDVNSLCDVPEVKLVECQYVSDVSPLAAAQTVWIGACFNITDVAPLAHLNTLVLGGLEISDISMLGKVRNLALHDCTNVVTFPVPKFGKGQKWEFNHMGIADVSELASLESLKLVYCEEVKDISMLGHVHYLHIEECRNLFGEDNFPTPLGCRQEWTFASIHVKFIAPRKFRGLHRLKLENCELESVSNFSDIAILHLKLCFLEQAMIVYIAVNELLVEDCRTSEKQFSEWRIEDNTDINHLELIAGANPMFTIRFSCPIEVKPTSITVKSSSGSILVDLAEEDLVDAELLIVDNHSSYSRLFTTNDLRRSHQIMSSSTVLSDDTFTYSCGAVVLGHSESDLCLW